MAQGAGTEKSYCDEHVHVYTALLSWTPSSHSDELFVGGVSKRMKAVELQKHFERFGSVENVELITDKTGADSALNFNFGTRASPRDHATWRRRRGRFVTARRRHAPDGESENGQPARGHGGPRWKA